MIIVTSAVYAGAFEAAGVFYVGAFGAFGDIYRFNVHNLQCSDDFYSEQPLRCNDLETITGVKGNPVSGYTNAMVKGLGIHKQSINYMPSGFANYFPNIVGLELANSNLKVIRKQDLSPFKVLEAIVMHGNRLESLELDTFEGNPNIVSIYLANNDFKHLNPKTFDPLPKLQALDFSSNRCISMSANTPQQLAELKIEMRLQCKSVGDQIADAIALEDEKDNLAVSKLEAEIEKLKSIVMQFASNDNKEYCESQLKILGNCMSRASQLQK